MLPSGLVMPRKDDYRGESVGGSNSNSNERRSEEDRDMQGGELGRRRGIMHRERVRGVEMTLAEGRQWKSRTRGADQAGEVWLEGIRLRLY